MSKTKSKSSSKLGTDSRSQRLGIKIAAGQKVKAGQILVRQNGTKFLAGENVGLGKDYTLFALKSGTCSYRTKKRIRFTGTKRLVKIVSVKAS